MSLRYSPALLGVLALSMLSSVGCLATHKHVREAIAPVQDQVNKTQGQVNSLQKEADDNKQSIGDLDRQVATADEKASEANKKAAEAADAAAKANAAASDAAQKATAANTAATDAQQGVSRVDQNLQNVVSNLDNYKLVSTQPVYFGFAKSSLSREDQGKLDDAIQKVNGMKNYLIEVEGYADRTGDVGYNRELSRKRADAVVHYLAVEHSIPLRAIRELGVGSDFPDADNKTREARKENRRVDVKIYSLDLNGAVQQATAKSEVQ
ncbi:MAG TPA: OmpA family protein [Bryobacteraceae bacterium]|nr:OmpA family protein [Bryobacteraceae bacterium]